jgi:alkylated DNA repair dioxygenase AlkB
MKLVPETSAIKNWVPFLEDPKTQCFSYLLPFKDNADETSPHAWTTRSQLDQWFSALHPSRYTDQEEGSWTDSYYKGELLLRKTAWTTFPQDCHCDYGYSDTWQIQASSQEFQNTIQEITQAIVKVTGCTSLNCCNLNYYPQGGGVGWHADDEFLFDGLHQPTCIVSLSLCSSNGGARKFLVKPKLEQSEDATQNKYSTTEEDIHEQILHHGDLMTMEGMFQKYYFHSVWPGDSKMVSDEYTQGERINLTWRTITKHLDGSEECRGKVCSLSKQATAASSVSRSRKNHLQMELC